MEIAQEHPLTTALRLLAPVVGGNFLLEDMRQKNSTGAAKYPAIEYKILAQVGAPKLEGRNAFRVETLVQLDYLIKEANLTKYCKENSLDGMKDIYALFNLFHARLRAFVLFLTNPTGINRSYKACDFLHTKFDFKIVKFNMGHNFRNFTADKLTGVSQTWTLSYLETQSNAQYCCIDQNLEELLKVVEEGSVTYQIIQNKLNPNP